MSKEQTDQQKLWDLIKDTRFGMLTHRHSDGRLHSHPLTTQNKELAADNLLYFFVSKSSELGQRLQQDGNVNIAYAHLDKDAYVSVTGLARVGDDMAKKRELFNAFVKAWFPNGPEDPDLELIEVRIEEAEYWDVKQSKLRQLFTMAKAAVTGNPPVNMGEHAEIRLG